jgi:cytochrome c peroxidase
MRSARAGAIVSTALMALVAVPLVGAAPVTHRSRPHTFTKSELAAVYALSPLGAPPPDPTDRVAQDPRAARLGQYLFFDRRLSANGTLSCATCHQPARAFTDGRALAKGLALGTRNVPTLLNVAYNHWFFWDGRADSLWSQPLQVFENPKEMGSDRLHVAHAVYADRLLRHAYEQLFGPMPPLEDTVRFPRHARPDSDPQASPARAWRAMAPADRTAANRVAANVGKAIEAYERELVSRDSAFDRYVAGLKNHDPGELAVLSPAARRGLSLFVGAAHCDLCHAGPDFSDGEFHDIALPLLPDEAPDGGRAAGIRELEANPFNSAGPYSDDPDGPAKQRLTFLPPPDSQLGKFKTPTLRNVALTGPYMHDGRMATLRQVLQFYADGKAASHGHVVGKREATLDVIPHLTQAQISDLVAFLDSLTGAPLPAALTRKPPSP